MNGKSCLIPLLFQPEKKSTILMTLFINETTKLKGDSNCRTQNVAYLMSSSKCGKQYVGETKGPLNIRMNGHRDDWRHKRFERSPVAEHFCLPGHDFLPLFAV